MSPDFRQYRWLTLPVCLLYAQSLLAQRAPQQVPESAPESLFPKDAHISDGQDSFVRSSPSPDQLDIIEVTGVSRTRRNLPGAVSVLDGEALRDAQRQVNLSESLQRAPGFTAFDRQNYAQDLQIQSRGFGARSTFGIRGIRLIVDGIPASAADGQAQAASFPLSTLDRVEVLRGPLALQYGNAAGGVIVGRSEPADVGGFAFEAWGGSDDSTRGSMRGDLVSRTGDWRGRLSVSRFATDGPREHGAARRVQANALLSWTPTPRDRVQTVVNLLRQPRAEDPLGLTRAAFDRDSSDTDAAALQFDTRKDVAENQLGLRWERDDDGRGFWLGAYRIGREVEQFLAVPAAAQRAASSAGGVIDLDRKTHGIDAGWRWRRERGGVAFGLEAIRLDEDRRGYENFIGTRVGVRGRLRRDEHNRVDSLDLWGAADFSPAQDWTVLAGVRRSQLSFRSRDFFFAPGNADDSGRMRDGASAWSLGAVRAFAQGEAYASLGRGYETPTMTELAYRPDGQAGLNRDLRKARVGSGEVGSRWRRGGHEGSVAVYRIDGRDEIVPAVNLGGRASFANAGRTRRVGVELGLSGDLSETWSYRIAASGIRARFVEDFAFRTATGTQTVAAGNRVPGIPRADAFVELIWRSDDGRWSSALEARALGGIAVDDRNSDAAAGNLRIAWRGRWQAGPQGWYGFVRVDNLFDREYAGSVIVNEANGRFFEPAAGRAFTLGVGWSGRR